MWVVGAGPNWVVPTPAAGNSSNRAASTEFVTRAIASTLTTAIITAGIVSTIQIDFLAGGLGNPAAQDYNLVEKLPFAVTLNEIAAKNSTGTLTAVLKINSATVTGGTLAVGTSQVSTTCTALHTAAIGSTIVLTLSVVTSAANLSFTVKYTKTLAAS